MNKQYFSELADYNSWRNNIAFDWLGQIDDKQWEREISSSFNSIKKTTLHIVSAEKIWLDYWNKVPHPAFLSSSFKGSKNDLLAIWGNASLDLKAFIDQYPENGYMQHVVFNWPGGEQGGMAFWQTFSHFINHSTYHRGQLVTLLRQAGFTNFSSTDLATYYRKK